LLSLNIDTIPDFNGAFSDDICSDYIKDRGLDNAISTEEVETLEAMVSNEAELRSKEFLRTITPDKLDWSTIGNDIEVLLSFDMSIS
jgi:hypothetical protein